MTDKASEIWRKVKPFAVRDLGSGVSSSSSGSGSGGIGVHALDGAYHTGTLPWGDVDKTGSDLADLATKEADDLNAAAGTSNQLLKVAGDGSVGYETTYSDISAGSRVPRSDGSGGLTLVDLDAETISAGVNLTVQPTTDLVLSPGGDVVMSTNQETSNFATGATGAQIQWANGSAEFRNLEVDSLIAEQFVAAVNRAAVGRLRVAKSLALLTRSATVPISGTFKIYVTNIPGVNSQMQSFVDGDTIQIMYAKQASASAGTPQGDVATGASDDDNPGSGGATTHLDEDFETYTPPADPSNWKITGVGNSTTTDASTFATFTDPDDSANETFGPDMATADSNYHAHWNGTGSDTLADYRWTGRFKLTDGIAGINAEDAGVGFTVLSKYTDSTPADTYIRIRRYSTGGSGSPYAFHVSNHTYAAPTGGTSVSSFIPGEDVWYRWKIEIEDDGSQTDLRVRFWTEGSSEPSTWDIDCYWTGGSRPQTGTFGFWGYLSDSGEVLYDDLLVESLAGSGGLNASTTVTLDLSTADYAIAVVTQDTGSQAPTAPAGWTLLNTPTTVNGYRTYVYEDTTPSGSSHTFSNSLAGFMQATIYPFTDVETTGRVSAFTEISTGTSSMAAPDDGTSTNGTDRLMLNVFATHGDVPTSVTFSNAPSPTTETTGTNNATTDKCGHYAYSFERDTGYTSGDLAVSPNQTGVAITISLESTLSASSGGGLWLGSVYGTVVEDAVTARNEDEQVYTVTPTRIEPTNASWQITIPADTAVLDLGVTGDGWWEASAFSGTDTVPYSRIATWSTNAWTPVVKTQMGNLKGIGSASGDWGFWSEHGSSVAELSDAANVLKNIDIELYNGATIDGRISATDGITLRAHDQSALEPRRTLKWANGTDLDTMSIQIGPQETGSFYHLYHTNSFTSTTVAPTFRWYLFNTSGTFGESAIMQLSQGHASTNSSFFINTQDIVFDADDWYSGNFASKVGWTSFSTSDFNTTYWGQYDVDEPSGTYTDVSWKRIGDMVYLRGLVKVKATIDTAAKAVVLTLPSEIAPATASGRVEIFSVMGTRGSTQNGMHRMNLTEDSGAMKLKMQDTTGWITNNWITLSGIVYSTQGT